METTASRAAPPHRLARPGLKRARTPTTLKEETNDHIAWQQQQPLGAFDPSAAAQHRTRGPWQGGEGASATGGAKDDGGSVGTGEGGGGRGHLRGPARHRSAAASHVPRQRASTTAVLAVALLRATAAAAAAAVATVTSPVPADFRPAATALSSRLCSPAEGSRAYVTTIAAIGGGFGASGGSNGDKSGDRLLGARVLAQSLRSAGAKGDIVVLVPLERATGPTLDSLRRDGLTVQIVPKGLQSAGGEIVSEELMTKVSLWSLTSYDRVVFLDPRSLIQKNPDALFACEGFCAAGAVHSPSSSPSFQPGWAQEAGAAVGAAAQQQPPPVSLAHGLGGSGEEDDDDDEHDGVAAAAAAAVLEKPLSVPPSWQPSTSVMVLEPSLEVHAAMLDKLTRTPAAGSLEAQVFLSSFLMGAGTDAGDRCTQFEDPVENAPSDRGRSRGGGLVAGQGGGGGWEDEEAGGAIFQGDGGFGDAGVDGGGSFLEDALMPVVLLNGPHVPRCSAGRKRTSEGVCQRLPYTFAAPSTDFQGGKNSWGGGAQKDDRVTPEPHIVHFADEDTPWKRLAYLHKPLFWKWNAYREQLECPYGNFFAPWVLFFIPCVVLAFARVYYKTASGGSGGSGRNRRTPYGGGGGAADLPQDGCSPSKSRIPWLRSTKQLPEHQQHQQQLAILPACRMAAAYDGAATAGAGCLEAAAASRIRNSSGGGGGGGGVCIAVGADPSSSFPPSCLAAGGGGGGGGGGEQQLPLGVCYVLSTLVGMFGLLWFRGARALAREVVDAGWHPVISVSVHDAWLCCALVVGLYVMDYLFFALVTRGRTLPKDSVAVAAVVFAARFLHSMAMDGEGSSSGGGGGGGGGVIWAGVVGAGVIALGFGHGSRAGVVHHLSGRAHFRCVAASCVVNTAISLAVCCAGPEAHRVATRRIQSAAVTAQMVFIALVYASVIGGARLRSDIDEAGSKIGRTCSSASFVADALIGAASGKGGSSTSAGAAGAAVVAAVAAAVAAPSSLLVAQERASEGRASGVVVGGGGGGGGEGAQRWSAVSWIKKLTWHRRRVAAGIALLVLWKVSSANLRPASPARHFEKYGQSCLESQAGFVEAGGKRLSRVCGAEQALRPVATGAYFEAFRQDKVCLEVAGGGFLTLGRVHVAQACLPEFQFVFQEVAPTKLSSKDKGDGSGGGGRLVVGGGTAAESVEYCIYNPASGFYLSAQGRPRAQCGAMEHWRVRAAPLAPGLKGGGGSLAGSGGTSTKAKSAFSALLHPNFLSRAPLLTFYGYLLAATALLVARALFSMLATSPCVGATGRGSSSGSGGGGGHKHHRDLGARQRSRGRAHSRSHGSSFGGFVDTGYLGDPGYAGDAETGGEVTRGPSVSPVAAAGGQRPECMGWDVDVMDMERLGSAGVSGAGGRPARHPLRREASSSAGSAAPTCGGLLSKVLSGLVVACDATLLAGLWCLVPAHFAQAMTALTRDHHSAIDQGLGMDSNAAPADNIWSRSLGEGVDSGGGDGEAESEAAAAVSCDSGAWWVMSALVRWHLLFLLVAFCHLHGAVSASSSAASTQRWRNRRTGKKAKASAGAAELRRRSPRSFWGLRSGERLAMRLRTAMGVLTLLLLSAVLLLPERSGLLFAGLHKHPGWARCAPAAGLDESWGVVSPLLVFAVLAATCGVYLRAGSSPAVRCLAAAALVVAGAAVAAASGREYLVLALAAAAMDWAAWAIAGVMSCVCYQTEEDGDGGGLSTTAAAPRPRPAAAERESSGSTDGGDGGRRTVTSTGTSRGSGVRHRMNEAARRMSPTRWVVGIRGRGRNGGRVLGESVARSAESNL
ncbi:GT8 [Ectocarpus sp. CCAP 1310/34]|nr:GT8 [Ectocarpus sp. CCAP 1310/34]